MKFTDKQIKELIEAIFEGSITSGNLPEDLYFAIADHIKEGLYDGFGGGLDSFEFGGKDYELLNDLRTNVYLFSGAKTFQQVSEMQSLIADAPNFKAFRDEVMKVYEKYNVDWLKAEYNTAIGQAKSASIWSDIEQDKELFPYLRYSSVMDSNTSDICRPLNGIVAPVDAAIWNKYSPLNHFNCRCLLEKIDKYENVKPTGKARVNEVTKQMDDKVADEFKMNAGKDGYIFSPKHPYFEVAPKDKAFAKRNFDLPIPKKD